jgi:hypothetical protein
MAERIVKSWRGIIRGELKAGARVLTSLQNWSTKPGNSLLFTPDQFNQLSAVISLFQAKLVETKSV